MNEPAYTAGFTLLEALVTIVIVSIGLLGLLGLQSVSVVNTQVSAARTQATFAADSIADRMRANRAGVANNEYAGIDTGSEPSVLCDDGNTCTPRQMAVYDTYIWNKSLGDQSDNGRGLLPNGKGAIECLETDGSACLRYRVTVSWDERDPGDAGGVSTPTTRTFETVVQP